MALISFTLPPQPHLLPPPPPPPPVPIGYRFAPKNHELLNYYLTPKINGTFVPSPYPKITDVDIYGEHPSKILALDGGYSLEEGEEEDDEEGAVNRYFFTKLKKTTKRGSRISRRVRNLGTWKAEYTKDILMPKTRMVIGYNKYFKFEADKSEHDDEIEDEVEWLMHEYSLADNQEMVICRITKKINKKAVANNNKRRAKKRAIFNDQSSTRVVEDKDLQVIKRSRLEHSSNCMSQETSEVNDHNEVQKQPSAWVYENGSDPLIVNDEHHENGQVQQGSLSRACGSGSDPLVETNEDLTNFLFNSLDSDEPVDEESKRKLDAWVDELAFCLMN